MDKKPMTLEDVIAEVLTPTFPFLMDWLATILPALFTTLDQYIDSRIDAKLNERDGDNA